MALRSLKYLGGWSQMFSRKVVFWFAITISVVSLSTKCVYPVPASQTGNQVTAMYFVSPQGNDLNSGKQTEPWATLHHAAEMVMPGATVEVAPGLYVENELAFNNSGSSRGRIRFISGKTWGAKIRSSSSYTVVRLNGSYLDFVGFDVAGDPDSCLGIADWGSNNQILNNHVHHIPAPAGVCKSNGGAGIDSANYKGRDSDVIGNTVHDIGSWPSEDDRVHGIYHANYGGRVWNNLVYRCAGFGIDLSHFPDHTLVANNTIFNNVYGGIYLAEDNGGTRIAVVNNIVVHNKGWGIVEPHGETPPDSGNVYLNNLIFDNSGYGDISVNPGSIVSGTIFADPQFVRYTGGSDGDYSLRETSLARDHGSEKYAPGDDINGGLRPVNGSWDIGAYEYGSKPPAEVTR